MPDDDWPKQWPVEPIPTNSPGPPYFLGDFQLHVYPTDFKIVRDSLPFYFWIRNNTQDTVEFKIFCKGELSVVSNEVGILKPMQISQPIGLGIIEKKSDSLERTPDDDVFVGYRKNPKDEKADSWNMDARFYPRFFFDPPMKPFEKKKFEEFKSIGIGGTPKAENKKKQVETKKFEELKPVENGQNPKAENKAEPVEAEKVGHKKQKKCTVM